MVIVKWSGVNHGYVEADDKSVVTPFVFEKEGSGWKLTLHGGLTSRQLNSDWESKSTEELEKEVLWLYGRQGVSCSYE
jgi:hypothetical protein